MTVIVLVYWLVLYLIVISVPAIILMVQKKIWLGKYSVYFNSV